MIKSNTQHVVECSECRFTRTFNTTKEAREVDERHKGYHRDFSVGTRVFTPLLRGMEPTRIGTIKIIYDDYEEVFVDLDTKHECFECKHTHYIDDWWRGKTSEIVVAK